MTNNKIQEYYNGITNLWKFMKEFLTRGDIHSDAYWKDVVHKSSEYTKDQNNFIKGLFVDAMKELSDLEKKDRGLPFQD